MPSDSPAASILVVDDHPGVRASAAAVLAAPGRRVLTAAGGAEGLALLAREAVDLVVSDLDMPKMNGLAFLAEVRRLHPGLACLLVTGRITPAAEAAVKRGEILACVSKGGDPEALPAAVERALRGKGRGG